MLGGMAVTWKELWTKKVTQQYPENRETLVISDRWRSELTMPHDENNEHACTACGICEMNCPNGTITVNFKMVETEDGKKKKVLDTYKWDLGMCTFCNLCVLTCPSDAIKFENTFENAVFTRDKLKQQLNHEGSKMREKKKPERPVAPAAPAAAVKAPVEAPEVKAEAPVVETPVVEAKAPVAASEVKTEQPISAVLESVKESKTEAVEAPVTPEAPAKEADATVETSEK